MTKQKRRHRDQPLTQVPQRGSSGTLSVGALRINVAEQSLAIDVTKVDAPDRAYDADVAWVEHRPGNVSLIFAKLNRDEPDTVKSRLEVRYPAEDLLLTFWGNSRGYFLKLSNYVAAWPDAARRTIEPPTTAPASQSHSEWASFTYMSHSGTEASIDFYDLPPSGLARYAQRQDTTALKLRPVVRVQMTTFELFRLIERVQPFIDAIREYLPNIHSAAKQVPSSFGDDEQTEPAAREYGS